VASVVRIATIGLMTAMELLAMGIADDIVNLVFGLTLGAVAVAFAYRLAWVGARRPGGRGSTGVRGCAGKTRCSDAPRQAADAQMCRWLTESTAH
jgi:hypothetical protein